MPAMNKKYTINIEPQGDHLVVTIPEIDTTIQVTGCTLRDAETAAQKAIIDHLMQQRKRRPRRPLKAS